MMEYSSSEGLGDTGQAWSAVLLLLIFGVACRLGPNNCQRFPNPLGVLLITSFLLLSFANLHMNTQILLQNDSVIVWIS